MTALRLLGRLKAELRDFIEVVALPALAMVLPWPICYRVLRWLARWSWLYRAETERAFAQAKALGWVHGDENAWRQLKRLTSLVDHADHYLTRTRNDAWMQKHLSVTGSWPAADAPGLLLTFHWGAGMWAQRHAGAAGVKASMMVDAPTPEHFQGHRVLFRYIQARIRSIELALHTPTVDAGKSLRPVLATLRRRENIMAVIDVPADQVAATVNGELFGRAAHIPKALLRVGVEQAIPVTLYMTGYRIADGQRTLEIIQLGVYQDIDKLASDIFAALNDAIGRQPTAWHLWGEAPRFFNAATPETN